MSNNEILRIFTPEDPEAAAVPSNVEPFGLDAMVRFDPYDIAPLSSKESITWTDKVTEEGDVYPAVDGTAKND